MARAGRCQARTQEARILRCIRATEDAAWRRSGAAICGQTSWEWPLAMTTGRAVTVGVVGLGYWGPNLARNFASVEGCELRWCCDRDDARRAAWQDAFPSARFTAELGDLLADPELGAIVIATDVPSH